LLTFWANIKYGAIYTIRISILKTEERRDRQHKLLNFMDPLKSISRAMTAPSDSEHE